MHLVVNLIDGFFDRGLAVCLPFEFLRDMLLRTANTKAYLGSCNRPTVQGPAKDEN